MANKNENINSSLNAHMEPLLSSEIDKEPVAFAWPHITEDCRRMDYVYLGKTEEDVYALTLYQNPPPNSMPNEIRSKMKPKTHKGVEYHHLNVGKNPEVYNLEQACEFLAGTHETLEGMRQSYYEKLASSEKAKTEKLEPKDLEKLIKENNVLFYTGAGISVAGGLPSGDTLRKEMGVQMGKEVDTFTKNLVNNPNDQLNKLKKLQKAFYGEPTPAHIALEKIRENNPDSVVIATENLDKLHQKAGSQIVTLGKVSKIPNEAFEQTDYIVTVGLQQAFTDLLKEYKEANPDGKIIALNTNEPPYQYPADCYIQGDAQEILADVAEVSTTSAN